MSKKGSTSTTNVSKQALPYLQAGSNAATGAYNSNSGNVANITDTLNGNIGSVLGTTLNNPALSAASTYDQNTLNASADPNSNPYMAAILKQTTANATDAANSSIGTRGLTGGSAQAQLVAKTVADANNQAAFGQYNTNVANQNQAASNATSIAGAQNGGIASLLSYLTGTAELPGTVANQYADTLGSLWGNKTTTTQTPSTASSIQSGVGTALSLASLFSDRRLKTDIEKIGEEPDGLGVYRYRYKAGGPMRQGVMADEVARIRPWALGPVVSGVATVNYGRL